MLERPSSATFGRRLSKGAKADPKRFEANGNANRKKASQHTSAMTGGTSRSDAEFIGSLSVRRSSKPLWFCIVRWLASETLAEVYVSPLLLKLAKIASASRRYRQITYLAQDQIS